MPLREEILGLRSPRSRLLLILLLVAAGMVGGLANRGTQDLWDVDRTRFVDSAFVETRGFPSGWLVLSTPENASLTKKRFAPIPFARSALAWLAFSTLGFGSSIAVSRKVRGVALLQPCSPLLRLFSATATWLGACGLLALEPGSLDWKLAPGLAVGLIGSAAIALLPTGKPVRWLGLVLAEFLAVVLMSSALLPSYGGVARQAGTFDDLPFVSIVLLICLGLEVLFRIALCPPLIEG